LSLSSSAGAIEPAPPRSDASLRGIPRRRGEDSDAAEEQAAVDILKMVDQAGLAAHRATSSPQRPTLGEETIQEYRCSAILARGGYVHKRTAETDEYLVYLGAHATLSDRHEAPELIQARAAQDLVSGERQVELEEKSPDKAEEREPETKEPRPKKEEQAKEHTPEENRLPGKEAGLRREDGGLEEARREEAAKERGKEEGEEEEEEDEEGGEEAEDQSMMLLFGIAGAAAIYRLLKNSGLFKCLGSNQADYVMLPRTPASSARPGVVAGRAPESWDGARNMAVPRRTPGR